MSCTSSVDFIIKKQKNRTHFPLTFFQSGSYCLLSTCSVPGRVTGHRPATRMTRRDFPPQGIKDHEFHEDRARDMENHLLWADTYRRCHNPADVAHHQGNTCQVTVKYLLPPVRMVIIKNRREKHWWVEKRKPEYYGWSSHCGKEYVASSNTLKIESASNAASLLPSVFPKETKALSWNAICTPTSVAVLFTKTKAQKQPKHSSISR